MWSFVLFAVMSVSRPAPVACGPQDSQWTLEACRARGVAVWSVSTVPEGGEDPVHTAWTVQAAGRCGWFQKPAEPGMQPEQVCPAAGTPQACVLRQTAVRCRK